MADNHVQRRLAAILVADVVGYSRLMERDEEGTRARLRSLHAEVIDPRIAANGGRIVKTSGDGVLVEFGSVVNAVQNALAIQTAMSGRNAALPEDLRIVFRIGINVGDVIVEGDDIHGDGVNVAARLEGLCGPGEVYVSGIVYDQASGKLEAAFDDLGEQLVKNIARPVRVYRARSHSEDTFAKPNDAAQLALPDKPSIAVLPFDNLSGDPEQEYFSDGISEDIITELSRIRWFFVTARNSSFSYKGQSPDIRQVARELGVRYVLEGSVRKVGNRVRITAQLIDGASGNHVWAERYDRELEDIFAVQDEITGTVVAAIEPELSRAEQERARRKPPENLDAWDCYQRGLWHVWRFSKADNEEARRLFQRAVERDPNFSSAFAGLAYGYIQGFAVSHINREDDPLATAAIAARKAVALDNRNSFAYWALGGFYLFSRDFPSAITELRKSLDLNPSFAPTRLWIGTAQLAVGQTQEAKASMDAGLRLSPKDPMQSLFMTVRACAHLTMDEFDEAEAWGRKAISGFNSHQTAYGVHAAALGYLNRDEEAGATMEAMRPMNSENFIKRVAMQAPFFANESLLAKFVEGLRKAGIEE